MEENNTRTCGNCGASVSNKQAFCGVCGTAQSQTIDVVALDLIEENSQHYLSLFREMQPPTSRIISWNWAAFLCGPLWFLYRKMYGIGLLLMAVNAFIPRYFIPAILAATGLFGNYLYFRHIESRKKTYISLPEDRRAAYVKRHGGISRKAVVTVLVTAGVLIFLVSLFSLLFPKLFMWLLNGVQ